VETAAGFAGALPEFGAAAVLLAAFGYVLRQWHLDRKAWGEERHAWAEERQGLIKGCDEQLAEKRRINQELRKDLADAREGEDRERTRRRDLEEQLHRAGLRDRDQ
jgi:hypothetical protein